MKYLMPLLILFNTIAQAQPNHIVISQVYGGGGNTGAVFTHDFIELFNPTALPIDLTGVSLLYSSAAGTTWNPIVSLTGTMLPKKYILIQLSGGVNGTALPSAEFSATNNLSAASGKLALIQSFSAITGSCPVSPQILDFLGYGAASCSENQPAPQGSNTIAITRKAAGCLDTDNNALDFIGGPPSPKNSSSPDGDCSILNSNLPIYFTQEKAWVQNGRLAVSWVNESESEVLYYLVEGTENGNDFESLQKLLPAKNDGMKMDYLANIQRTSGINYIRIKGVEFNGKTTFSRIIPVLKGQVSALILLYPNPAGNELNIVSGEMKSGDILTIFSATGNKTEEIKVGPSQAHFKIKLSLEHYLPGLYFMSVNGAMAGRFIKM